MLKGVISSYVMLCAAVVVANQQFSSASVKALAVEGRIDRMENLVSAGPAHDFLNQLAGQWDVSIVRWQNPDSKPAHLTGRSDIQWDSDGRLLRHQHQSNDNRVNPVGYWGYNEQRSEYIHVCKDESGRIYASSLFSRTESPNNLMFYERYIDPMTNQAWLLKSIMTMQSTNEFKIVVNILDANGHENRGQEMTFRRIGQ